MLKYQEKNKLLLSDTYIHVNECLTLQNRVSSRRVNTKTQDKT